MQSPNDMGKCSSTFMEKKAIDKSLKRDLKDMCPSNNSD